MPAPLGLAFALVAITARTPVVPPPPDAAVIRSSGSTNASGFTLAVRPGGAATVATGGATTSAVVDPARAARLFAALRAAGGVARLGSDRCMRSTSFGTTLTVAWHGQTSRDLSCRGRSAAATDDALTAAIAAIVARLDLARPQSRRFPL